MPLDPNIEYPYEELEDHPDQEEVIQYLLATEPLWTREDAIDFMNPKYSPIDTFDSEDEMPERLKKAIRESPYTS